MFAKHLSYRPINSAKDSLTNVRVNCAFLLSFVFFLLCVVLLVLISRSVLYMLVYKLVCQNICEKTPRNIEKLYELIFYRYFDVKSNFDFLLLHY